MSTDLSPIAFRRLEAIGYIPGECNPIAWMLDRLERAAKVKPDDAAALIRRAHDMVRDLCKRRDEPGAREWQMSIPARPDHDPDLVIGAALDAADDLASEVGRLRDALATVTRERDEARKALATEEHNHELTIARRDDAQSWADSLANQIAEAAGHEIGEHSNLNNPWDNAQDGLVKLVRERDEARAERDNERASFARALVAAHAETANALDALTWLVEQEIPCDAQGSYDSSFITNHAIALRTLIAAGRMVEIFDDGGRSVEAKMKPEPDAALAGARS